MSKAKAPVIYVITNTANGKQYVGQTRCGVVERWRKHWSRSETNSGACPALAAAIRKYGKDAFTIDVIHELPLDAPQQEIDAAEQTAIRERGTLSPNGYNLEEGGKGGRPSAETRAKRSAALKGKPLSDEHRRKLSESQKGRKRTSTAEIAGYKRRVDMLTGVPRSPEIIAKAVATRRGKPKTEAEKAAAKRHSEFMTGRTESSEHRAKISQSMKAYHENKRKAAECQKPSC